MHNGAQWPILGDGVEQRRDSATIGGVARGGSDMGPGACQFIDERRHAEARVSAAADEQEIPDAASEHQVACHRPAERAGGASDQHSAVGEVHRRGFGGRSGNQPGHPHRALLQRRLRLAGSEHSGELGPADLRCFGIEIDQRQTPGVLGLCGTDQAPDRCVGRVRVRAGGTTGHQDQLCGPEVFVRKPVPQQLDGAGDQPVGQGRYAPYRMGLGAGHEDPFHGRPRLRDCLAELCQVWIGLHGGAAVAQRAGQAGFALADHCPAGGGCDRASRSEFPPFHGEQRTMDRCHCLHRSKGQLRHPADRSSVHTGQVKGDTAPAGGLQSSSEGVRTGGGYAHAAPREWQCGARFGEVTEPHCMQHRIEQRGMHDVPATRVRQVFRQGHLDVKVVRAPPRGTQPAESRAVAQTLFCQLFIYRIEAERHGAGRRPVLGGLLGHILLGVSEHRGRVPDPGVFIGCSPMRFSGMNACRSPSCRVRGSDGELNVHRASFGDDQWRFQCQIIEHVVSEVRARMESQIDEGRAGQQDLIAHGVVGEPRMCRERDPAGEDHGVRIRGACHRVEQRVMGAVEPDRVRVSGGGVVVQPVAGVLEGVGGQRGRASPGLRVVVLPIGADSVRHELAECGGESRCFGLVVALGGDGGVGQVRGQGVGWADFEEGGGVGVERAGGAGELHGVPGVLDPVVGVGQRGVVDELPGAGRDDRHRGGLGLQFRRGVAEFGEDGLHQR